MKSILKATLASLAICAAGNVHAGPILYDITIQYADNASFNGTFDFDASSQQLTNEQGILADANGWTTLNMSVSPGGLQGPINDTYDWVTNNTANPIVYVGFDISNATPTLDLGPLGTNLSYSDGSGANFLNAAETGSIITAVPEPASLLLLTAGIMGFGASRKNILAA